VVKFFNRTPLKNSFHEALGVFAALCPLRYAFYLTNLPTSPKNKF